MVKRTSHKEALCPVARPLDAVGDSWSLLIVRDAFDGLRRFGEFQKAGRTGDVTSHVACLRRGPHPFGKVPVLDHGGMRILETLAITRYLNDVLPGRALVPASPQDRAPIGMIVGIIGSYRYRALGPGGRR